MLYLASQSPRRRELLARLGLRFAVLDLDVPELRQAGEAPADYVRRVAGDKARAGLGQVRDVADALVLGSDTEVVLNDDVFGKPADRDDAAAMLRRLSGRTHEVLSAVVAVSATRSDAVVVRTEVEFGPLDDADIEAYLDSGEAMGKAGAYAIQGLAERFVARIAGSHSGVMGLPLHETAALLRRFGLQVPPPADAPPVPPRAPVAARA